MLRLLSLTIITSLVFPFLCFADELSGLAVFPAGGTTVEELFDSSVRLLEGSGFPVTSSNRMKGEIVAAVTRYHTVNAGGGGKLLEDVQFWRLSIRRGSGGIIELEIARGSALKLQSGEIAQFIRSIASTVSLDPATISLTVNYEDAGSYAEPPSQEVSPTSRAITSGFVVDFCNFGVYEPLQAVRADFVAKFALEVGADGSIKDLADITKLTRADARRWGLQEEDIPSGSQWLIWTNNEAYAFSCLLGWKLAGVPPGTRVVAEFQWDHRYGWVSLHISGEGIDYMIKSGGCRRGDL